MLLPAAGCFSYKAGCFLFHSVLSSATGCLFLQLDVFSWGNAFFFTLCFLLHRFLFSATGCFFLMLNKCPGMLSHSLWAFSSAYSCNWMLSPDAGCFFYGCGVHSLSLCAFSGAMLSLLIQGAFFSCWVFSLKAVCFRLSVPFLKHPQITSRKIPNKYLFIVHRHPFILRQNNF